MLAKIDNLILQIEKKIKTEKEKKLNDAVLPHINVFDDEDNVVRNIIFKKHCYTVKTLINEKMEYNDKFYNILCQIEKNLIPEMYRGVHICSKCNKMKPLKSYRININGKIFIWFSSISHEYKCKNIGFNKEFIDIIFNIVGVNDIADIADYDYDELKNDDEENKPQKIVEKSVEKSEKIYNTYNEYCDDLDMSVCIATNLENYNKLISTIISFEALLICETDKDTFSKSRYDLLYGFMINNAIINDIKNITIYSNSGYPIIEMNQEIIRRTSHVDTNTNYSVICISIFPLPLIKSCHSTFDINIEMKNNVKINKNDIYTIYRNVDNRRRLCVEFESVLIPLLDNRLNFGFGMVFKSFGCMDDFLKYIDEKYEPDYISCEKYVNANEDSYTPIHPDLCDEDAKDDFIEFVKSTNRIYRFIKRFDKNNVTMTPYEHIRQVKEFSIKTTELINNSLSKMEAMI
ncbi:MAG: hypothetical protein Edafosvirus3_67 [Edafosvirus sp.]|uniref:Uncharacterized protein n=1 Tax=Edafosvirus sp. TaxID=2487765 RepID=A0A3G4ZX32_9VIRU|nr:MAG: hypothetical protein Edafosvirus3_67 [Edafosvirus sp.]